MSDLTITQLWFQRAVPSPTDKNKAVQLGVHFEEVSEMLDSLGANEEDILSRALLSDAQKSVKRLADALKAGQTSISVADRKELLDSLCDQIVTATGCGHMHNLQVPEGLTRVNTSNFSKFDANGMPIFDENGKIKKGPAFQKPNLEGLY